MDFKAVVKDLMPPLATRCAKKILRTMRGGETIPFVPQFFCALVHGAGSQSFLFYLNKIGMPSTYWLNSKLPEVMLSDHVVAKGFTADHNKKDDYLLFKNCNLDSKMPVYWLVRDPILVLTSCVNELIGDSVKIFKKEMFSVYGVNIKEDFDRWFKDDSGVLEYSSIIKKLPNVKNIHVIDTEDLRSEKCKKTMESVACVFNIGIETFDDSFFKIPYSAFLHRIWATVEPTVLDGVRVGFCPSFLYEFHFNHWIKTYKLIQIEKNDKKYTIFKYNYGDKIEISDNHVNSLFFYISLYEEYAETASNLYNKYKVSPDNIISFINKDSYYHDRIMRILDCELSILENNYPQIMNSWRYLKKIYR